MACAGLLLLLLTLTSLVLKCYSTSPNNVKTYIIYTGHNMNDETSSLMIYQRMLQEVSKSNSTPKSVLHHYKRSFHGFVAKLTDEEADKMARLDGVVAVFPDEKRQIHTTKSWDFIGFPENVETEHFESDIIIGVIDSGIWPESTSFNDKGFSPPPSKWKGTCLAFNFTCNNKLIGARYYLIDEIFDNTDFLLSPRDSIGHGTHVASIATGNPVSHASMLGLGRGTSRGGGSSARITVYKACWSSDGCGSSNILAAFDDAIADGVDILSVSLGGISEDPLSHFRDPISIGAFHAMQNGVLRVLSAGNKGPKRASLSNVSPLSIVVAAGTIDRKFVTKVKLGNNVTYEGISLNTFDLLGNMYPMIYGGDAPNKKAGFKGHQSRLCPANSLDEKSVKGKIVLCEGNIGGPEAFRAGAIGVLTQGHTFTDTAEPFVLPGCYL